MARGQRTAGTHRTSPTEATSPRLRNISNLHIRKNTNGNVDRRKQQRNTFPTRKQGKAPEELNDVKVGAVPEKRFRVTIVRMSKDPRRMGEQNKKIEVVSKEIEKI